MSNKGIRVAIEAVLAVVVFNIGHVIGGIFGDVIIVLGLILLVYAIIDLFKKQR
jgi:hypothetical protein